jgi:hypothetical protein
MRYRAPLTAVLIALAWAGLTSATANGPTFFRDDPIARDVETQDASKVRSSEISQLYDFTENSFLGAGEKADKRAQNINTIDEVPDSSWFTNRIGKAPWTIDQLTKGPDTGAGPVGKWTVISGKLEGRSPGFTIRDETGQMYFIKFDPPANPEMASGAEIISTKLLYAFGYHVPENYLAIVRPDNVSIQEGAMVDDRSGRRRRMDQRDLDEIFDRVARNEDGSARALASKGLEGKPVGPFRFYGTRPDDPNDIFPHEHRRELRGYRVISAWLNHDDSRSVNTLDTLVTVNGRTIVRHHLIDFGSTLGSGTIQAQSPRAGNEFLWESRPTFITMLTLGFYVRPWIKIPYPEIPSLGRIESDHFSPPDWKPEYPNTAFANARREDLFWGARILANLSDDAVRAIVGTAKYSNPKAAEYLSGVLVARKRRVLESWLNVTNPIVNPALSPTGQLTFENAAVRAGVATAAEHYTIQWSQFDNATGQHTSVGGEQTATDTRAQAPEALFASRPDFVAAVVRGYNAAHPGWQEPVALYFRRAGDGWTLVGLERD